MLSELCSVLGDTTRNQKGEYFVAKVRNGFKNKREAQCGVECAMFCPTKKNKCFVFCFSVHFVVNRIFFLQKFPNIVAKNKVFKENGSGHM